jgi:hypothetical protein
MEDPEVPTEHLHEEMHERAGHGAHAGPAKPAWTLGVALSSALLAALAAVCSLLAGHHSNEALIEQLKSSDQWAFYQAKGIKSAVLSTKLDLLAAEGKPIGAKDTEKVATYKHEQEEIQKQAEELQAAAGEHLHRHVIFARGVTLFQIAIAVGAISVLTNRKAFWFVSLAFGLIGAGFLAQGLIA